MKRTIAGYPDIDVAVAVIMNQDGQILWTWNDTWGTFSLPMTKIRVKPGVGRVAPRRCGACGGRGSGRSDTGR